MVPIHATSSPWGLCSAGGWTLGYRYMQARPGCSTVTDPAVLGITAWASLAEQAKRRTGWRQPASASRWIPAYRTYLVAPLLEAATGPRCRRVRSTQRPTSLTPSSSDWLSSCCEASSTFSASPHWRAQLLRRALPSPAAPRRQGDLRECGRTPTSRRRSSGR